LAASNPRFATASRGRTRRNVFRARPFSREAGNGKSISSAAASCGDLPRIRPCSPRPFPPMICAGGAPVRASSALPRTRIFLSPLERRHLHLRRCLPARIAFAAEWVLTPRAGMGLKRALLTILGVSGVAEEVPMTSDDVAVSILSPILPFNYRCPRRRVHANSEPRTKIAHPPMTLTAALYPNDSRASPVPRLWPSVKEDQFAIGNRILCFFVGRRPEGVRDDQSQGPVPDAELHMTRGRASVRGGAVAEDSLSR